MKWSTSNVCIFFLSLLINCSKSQIIDLKENFFIQPSIEDPSDFVKEFHQWFDIDGLGNPIKDVHIFYKFMANLNIDLSSFFRSFEQSFVRKTYQDRYLPHIRKMKDAFMQVFGDLRRIVGSKHYANRDANSTQGLKYVQRFANATFGKYAEENPVDVISQAIRLHFLKSDIFTSQAMEKDGYVEDVCVTQMTPSQLMDKLIQYFELATAAYYTTHAVIRDLTNHSMPDGQIKNNAAEQENSLTKNYNSLVGDYIAINPNLSRVLRACDSTDRVAGKTHHEVKIYEKMFVEKCRRSIGIFGYSPLSRPQCETVTDTQMCQDLKEGGSCALSRTCNGKIHCERLDSDKVVCLKKSSRDSKYDSYYSLGKLNDSNECRKPYDLKEKDFSEYIGFVNTQCTPCHCTCETNELYYSTDLVTTDIKENMVVTGARLELINNTLVIRVQQGKLASAGKIELYSLQWLPVNITNKKLLGQVSPEWIHLTMISLPPGEILTGLGFSDRVDSPSDNRHIFLQAQSNAFDFWNGTLYQNSSLSVAPATATTNRPQDVQKDIPANNGTEDPHQNLPSFIKRNQPVQFTISETKDGEHSTVPYIDGREVFSDPAMPMSGVGLYFRKKERNEGSIGIEFITHDHNTLENVESRNIKSSAQF